MNNQDRDTGLELGKCIFDFTVDHLLKPSVLIIVKLRVMSVLNF